MSTPLSPPKPITLEQIRLQEAEAALNLAALDQKIVTVIRTEWFPELVKKVNDDIERTVSIGGSQVSVNLYYCEWIKQCDTRFQSSGKLLELLIEFVKENYPELNYIPCEFILHWKLKLNGTERVGHDQYALSELSYSNGKIINLKQLTILPPIKW